MSMSILNHFLGLYQDKKQIALLSWAYGIIAVFATVVAGLIALVNQSLGVGIMIIPLVAIVAFSVNIIMWALIRFAIESAGVRIAEKRMEPYKKLGRELRNAATKTAIAGGKKSTKK